MCLVLNRHAVLCSVGDGTDAGGWSQGVATSVCSTPCASAQAGRKREILKFGRTLRTSDFSELFLRFWARN